MAAAKDRVKLGWPETVRDVFVTAIDRGQLPALLMGCVLLTVAFRLPPEQLVVFSEKILDRFASGVYVGWGVSLLLLVAWRAHSRYLIKIHSTEIDRIGREKSAIQDRAAGKPFQGSRNGKGGNQKG